MIEVRAVEPTARELRPVTRGWGALHGWMVVHQLTPFIGLWFLAVFVIKAAPWDDTIIATAALTALVTSAIWIASRLFLNRATIRAARSAPAAGMLSDWIIDAEGLSFRTPASSSRLSWAAIKGVRDERDRFVFLLSPGANPVLPKRQLSQEQMQTLGALIDEVTASGRLGRGVD